MSIPNYFTLGRLCAMPFLVLVYLLPFQWAHPAAAVVFAVFAVTDWLDGYLARHLGQATRFGAFLDPVVDKVIVSTGLVLIVSDVHIFYLVVPAVVIICREIVVSALREWMAEIGKRTSMSVTYVGKVKTTMQMISIGVLLWYQPLHSPMWWAWLGVFLLYVAAALTLWSMMVYIKISWNDLTSSQEQG